MQASTIIAPEIEVPEGQEYVRRGGPDADLVAKQAAKSLDQPKLADTLAALIPGECNLDLIVVGCGPAGMVLAAETAKKGLSVGLIGPDVPFVNNYGVWVDEFEAIGLRHCLDVIWQDTALYLDSDSPILVGRGYGRVSRELLRAELLERCAKAGVLYMDSSVRGIDDGATGSTVRCRNGQSVQSKLVTVASGAASGQLIEYEKGGPGVSVQTAYGIEVEIDNYPFDPTVMHFMDFRDYRGAGAGHANLDDLEEDQRPTFLYAMPITPTRIFFEETSLAARPAMSFDELKRRLYIRLKTLNLEVKTMHEEEWSYIPVGGALPVTTQPHLAFGAAANMVHPATGYSLARSLTEAPLFAAQIATALEASTGSASGSGRSMKEAACAAWDGLWSRERKRQSAFNVFGLELILRQDLDGTREFFDTFFRLPEPLWKGFLSSSLSSVDLLGFAFMMFVKGSNGLRYRLIEHLVTHPQGLRMLQVYAGVETGPKPKQLAGTVALAAFVATVAYMMTSMGGNTS
ncbi:lycopene epsilon cyclase [Klebsormidium nitens]|uniref:Lycopene epsilon cyclase n=1 Tax=Klebsormidium nitens TaxID=105231 RepID=A0A1Y1IFZ9_KLENI|nr:lycopene epsilon cyclase [Klebsormidium nitens]|eukprot:GAQ89563.1 lycopene epsilon cyclase [Klebsormidium nitens]